MALEFYNAGLLRQIATNLFYGWGYNFYRLENQLRADDLLVRSKCVLLLNAATESVAQAEHAYRTEFLPAPSRKQPYPDAAAVKGAQQLERLAHLLRGLAGRITAQPVPENDRMSQRYRQEAETLRTLIDHDAELAGRCEMLRGALAGLTGAAILEGMPQFTEGVAAIEAALLARQLVLVGVVTHTSQPRTFNL